MPSVTGTGTCFNMIYTGWTGFNGSQLDELSRIWFSSVNDTSGDKLLSPLQMANYTKRRKKTKSEDLVPSLIESFSGMTKAEVDDIIQNCKGNWLEILLDQTKDHMLN